MWLRAASAAQETCGCRGRKWPPRIPAEWTGEEGRVLQAVPLHGLPTLQAWLAALSTPSPSPWRLEEPPPPRGTPKPAKWLTGQEDGYGAEGAAEQWRQ